MYQIKLNIKKSKNVRTIQSKTFLIFVNWDINKLITIFKKNNNYLKKSRIK